MVTGITMRVANVGDVEAVLCRRRNIDNNAPSEHSDDDNGNDRFASESTMFKLHVIVILFL